MTPTGIGAITVTAATSNASILPAIFNETGVSAAAQPQLSVLPSAVTLSVVQGGDNPLPANIAVSNTGTGILQWTATDSGSPSWLTLGVASGATPAVLPAGINTSGLAAGTYKSTITVASGSQQQTVAVALTVVAASPAQFALSPAAVIVNAAAGSTGTVARAINVANGGTGTLTWSATAGAGATWLSVFPASGSSTAGQPPSTLVVQLNPSGLPAGQYLGNIALTSQGVPPANVPVVLNVAAQPNLISSVPSLQFRGAVGSSLSPQTLLVTTTNGIGVSFNASTSVTTGTNWLTLSGASGGTPNTISVSVNATGLTAGNYVGYVSVQSAGAANTLLVPVVLDLGNAASPGTLSASPGGVLFTGPFRSGFPG